MSDLIPPLVRDVSNYPLINMHNYSIPFARTEIMKRSCIPSSVNLWNEADNELKYSNTLQLFKYHQNMASTRNLKIPSYYFFGKRRLSVLHARMRTNCSNLNSDFFNNYLRPDPICSCQTEPENAEHYLFRCNKYNGQRLVLIISLRNYLPLRLEVLLSENQNLTEEDNTVIFEAVHTFIRTSTRFDDLTFLLLYT